MIQTGGRSERRHTIISGVCFFLVAVLLSAWIVCQANGQTADETKMIEAGKAELDSMKALAEKGLEKIAIDNAGKFNFSLAYIPFGVMVRASEEENTQLEAQEWIGGGPSGMVLYKDLIGVSGSILFYTGDNDKTYVMFAGGIVMKLPERFALSLAWDFGKITQTFNNAWQRRMRMMLSYNLEIVK